MTPLLDDSPEGRQFAKFARAFLRQSKGRWAGKPLELEPWQYRIIATMLVRDGGRRRFTEALLGLPRKNGKSTLSSAIALYFLILEGTLHDAGAEVYAAAASKDQAKIVFSEAKRMILSSPHLKDACQVYRDAIVVKDTGAIFRVLSADGRLQHGLNPSCVIIDELHAHRDPELYYALRTGSGAREEPLIISITTAGHDLGTVCGELYLRGVKGEDPRLFFHWLGVADDELDDPDAWAAANPASWITRQWLLEQSRSIPQAVFHRLHLNRWTRAEQLWLPKGAQAMCVTDETRFHDGDVVDLGVDMGRKHDTAAVAIVGPVDETTGLRAVDGMTWGAWPDPSKPAPNAHEPISGDRIPFDLVEDFIRDCARRFVVRTVAFDPWRFDRSAEILMNEGIEMLEFPQSNERMAPASQGLFDAVVETRLAFPDDKVIAGQMEAATAKQVGRDAWRLDKTQAAEAMDYAVALSIALKVAEDEDKTGSGFSIRFMDAVEGASSEDRLEVDDVVVEAALYRATPVPWETLDAERAHVVYTALGDLARVFTERGEAALADVCRAERGRKRALDRDAA